ncbi:helix-turn-helix domain-containing protein [Cellulosilyticum sp. I15G10I2]|uniref:helix-turn-helix domain-containing protein n=1 Tax=Cellulosilyticum sp. I15G10I2 TaxID=1892843 RepID=UPI00085C6154|nr:helix-turn-helix domain-containing protein [Cellulosilyticum sp. I15G10I2]
MIKLLIVDDEPLSLYAIRALVNRRFPDVSIIGEAKNGQEAVNLYKMLKPDMLIIDIKMPILNGIDASKQILEEFEEANILILTAYDSFNYVQNALNMGVRGYLLKPINDQDTVEKIRSLINTINYKKEKNNNDGTLEEKVNSIKPLVQKELISQMIYGSIKQEDLKNYAAFFQYNINKGYFMLIGFKKDISYNSGDEIQIKNIKSKILQGIKNLVVTMRKCIIGDFVGRGIPLWFPVDGNENSEEICKESKKIGEEIKRRISVVANVPVGIGIGNVATSIEFSKESYSEGYLALKAALKCNNVIHYIEMKESLAKENIRYPVQLEEKLIDLIKVGDIVQSKQVIEDILEGVFNEFSEMKDIKEYLSQLLSIVKRTMLQLGIGINTLTMIGTMDDLTHLSDIAEIRIWSRRNLFNILQLIEEIQDLKEKMIFTKIHSSIHKNVFADISLECIAQEVGISPQYLSKIFKEETGMNFIDYVTGKRISYAKKLLDNKDKSIREIAIAVGYSDSSYFTRIFKKIVGLTPKEYREFGMR